MGRTRMPRTQGTEWLSPASKHFASSAAQKSRLVPRTALYLTRRRKRARVFYVPRGSMAVQVPGWGW